MIADVARPYLAALRARFYLTLQYRAAAWAGVATQGWWGVMKIMVLAAFYHGAGRQPISLGQAIGYTWLGQAFLVLLPWNADPDVVEMVRSGAVAYERLRPVDTYAYWYARALAWTTARVLPRAIPMFALSALLLPLVGLGAWSLRPPPDVWAGVLFVISIICAGLLSTAMVQLVTGVVVATLSPRGANALARRCRTCCPAASCRCCCSRPGCARRCSSSRSPAWSTSRSASTSAS